MAELNPKVLSTVQDFMAQDVELESYLTGPAGSGKTTELRAVVDWLEETKVNYLMVAYTHQAKEIIQSKMPKTTPVRTLHSWLKKRPGLNEKAKSIQALMTNRQQGKPEHLQLLIVDEFSFVGDDDYMSIGELQDELLLEQVLCPCGREVSEDILYCESCDTPLTEAVTKNIPPIKVLYVGDLNQLSPIKGPTAPVPGGKYWTKLTEIHRSTTTISEPLAELVEMIEGTRPMAYLKPTENFVRGVDIDKLYMEDEEEKQMYAYTNKAVENHNKRIQGYAIPKDGDEVYIPTLRRVVEISHITDKAEVFDEILTANGVITMASKYKPLQFLNTLDYVKFYHLSDGTKVAGIFGSYQNKIIRDNLGKKLVNNNKNNKSSKAEYREYKAINDFVCNIDFRHCMTIHKAQGSEVKHSYVDSKDLAICQDKLERMKLLYVGMSRSTHSIFMSN